MTYENVPSTQTRITDFLWSGKRSLEKSILVSCFCKWICVFGQSNLLGPKYCQPMVSVKRESKFLHSPYVFYT